jgi:hypothetical protein
MFDVATLALGILGFGTGVASLTWNVVAFLWQGPRPKLTPIVGFRSGRGLVSINATRDARASLASAAKQVPPTGPLLVGLKVVNAGRAPFHVAEWAVRGDPSKTSLNPFDDWLDSPTVPRDIPPGASETFFTELNAATPWRQPARRSTENSSESSSLCRAAAAPSRRSPSSP